MVLSRTQVFLILCLLAAGPFLIRNGIWVANSKTTQGIVWFKGHTMELQSISSHPVIRFSNGKDSIWFNGRDGATLQENSLIPVRYQSDNPWDARVNTFTSVWGQTLVFMLYPCLALLVIFLTSVFSEPLIPKKIRLSLKKPFFRIPEEVNLQAAK